MEFEASNTRGDVDYVPYEEGLDEKDTLNGSHGITSAENWDGDLSVDLEQQSEGSALWNSSTPPLEPPFQSCNTDWTATAGYGPELTFSGTNVMDQTFSGENLDTSELYQKVCFGVLLDVSLKVKWGLNSLQPHITELNTRRYVALELKLQSKYGLVRFPQGRAIGVLNKNTFNALECCKLSTSFSTNMRISEEEWNDKMGRLRGRSSASSQRNGINMDAELVLSGSRDLAKDLAKSLGDHGLFLQPPDAELDGHCYENPQSLSLSDMLMEVDIGDFGVREALASRGLDDREDNPNPMQTAEAIRLGDLVTNIDKFFEQLPVLSHRPIALAPRDRRMISSLFEHQERGLEFMMRREARVTDHETNLWKLKFRSQGDQFYQHLITGAKSRTADDFLGGILADDMGLGKTLIALAAILASYDRAADFGSQRSDAETEYHASCMRSQATVVVVPSELLMNTWSQEISRHFYPGTIQFLKYHGPERRSYDYKLGQYQIILTTYGTVMAEFRRNNSALHRINWYRIILDEAHTIRNCSSKQFRALHSIRSHIRWCFTGTPIQNSLEDLGSLIRFLGMPLFNEPATFRKYVAMVRARRGSDAVDFENLRLILSSICLRRNRTILPGQGYKTEFCSPPLSDKERHQYRTLEQACKRAIQVGSKRQEDQKMHHQVMEALLRLRMFCNNGQDETKTFMWSRAGSRPDEILSFFQQSGEAMCAYCSVDILAIGALKDTESGYLTPCFRLICGECTEHYRVSEKDNLPFQCSFCNQHHDLNDSDGDREVVQVAAKRYPSKIKALMDNIKRQPATKKCIVFSFWKTSLDVVGSALADLKIKYLRVDGDMTTKKRSSTLMEFQSKHSFKVLLMTFSTGAAGLNGLTVASTVHLLEPQWNPAVENQAIGRVLRLDQQNKVTVVRYTVEKTIEKVIESRQLRKLQLAGGGFSGKEEKQKLRVNQWQQLKEHLDENETRT